MQLHLAAASIPAAPLLAVQETQGNALAQELREQALRLAEEGLRQGLAAEQAALEAARASGDAEAIRLHESRVLNMEQGLARVQERAGETEGAAAEMAEGQTFTIVPPPPPPAQPIPEGAVAISIVFMLSVVLLVLGFPIMRAMGRRGSRAQAVALPDPETQSQLREIGHAVDAIAIEVERISDSQRQLNRLHGVAPESVPAGQRQVR